MCIFRRGFVTFSVVGLTSLFLFVGQLQANVATSFYLDDELGNLAKVNVANGTVDLIGNTGFALTDIAFDPSGNLYGLTFDKLWRIDSTTAAATIVGSHGIPSGNSLVFGSDGILYAGGSNVYTVDPLTASSALIALIGDTEFNMSGDLAFHNGKLYGASFNPNSSESYSVDFLMDIDISTGASTAIGPIGFPWVFGLASSDNGILYGAAGTSIFSIDTTTGFGTLVFDYNGSGLGNAWGAASVISSTPPPPSPPDDGGGDTEPPPAPDLGDTDLSPPQGQLPPRDQPSQSSEIHGLVNLFPENPLNSSKPTIVITHGRTGATEEEKVKFDPDNPKGLFPLMTTAFRERFGEEGVSNYNIVAWKWEEEASYVVDPDNQFVGPIFAFLDSDERNGVLNAARGEGNALSKELIDKGLTKEVHLIGHSAGGTLINQTAKKIDEDTEKPVGQLTFLDAPWLSSADTTNTSEWADNYPSSFGIAGGEAQIIGAFNYDLRALSRGSDNEHGYAIDFYTSTIDCKGDEQLPCNFYADKGFAWSREGGNVDFGTKPDRNSSRNAADDLPEKPKDFVIGGESTPPTIGITLFETFDEIGDWKRAEKPVPFFEGMPIFSEASSAFLFKELTIPSDSTHFSFDFKFDQLGDGDYLTANFNQDLLFWFKGTSFYGDEFWNTGLLDISPYAGQHGMWTFGLNGIGEPNARMRIDNFAFYDVHFPEESGGLPGQNVVPEPSSLVLLGMGLFGGAFRFRRRSKVRVD